ncbi:hypothetical protein Esi_0109_0010 [Ectocarpus siliculosus]|uniref:Uncharacterized protein n=1 Tax=Ectocarpus siliculosus TaxID=2880 RepID=D7FHK7_ECTSI|nr:hypothetical protein Esi_0109_0010 [Ectocarpus siliculosus]|eukprot:CBJ28564.1 hypothetical protein Esi_0109_0010 [Ectocarpus siliculosus]
MNADSGGRGRKGSNDRGKGSKATSSSAFSTASSLGSNGSGRPPEAPPPLGRRDLDDGAHHLNHKKGLGSLSFKRKGSGGASNSSLSAANVPSMDLDSGFLSDGEADVLSPDHRSPAGVSVDASGGRRKSGGLKGGPRDDLSSSSQDGKISSGSVGGGSGDVGASFVQSMDSLGLPPDSSSSPASSSGVAVGAAAHPLRGLRAIGDHSRRSSDNSSAGSAADQRQWTPSVGRRAPASAGAGSDGSMSSSSIASASAVPGHRANGSSRSSFTLLRKKLTRSASLESEDSRLRGTEFGGPVGYRGRSGGSGDGLIGGGSGSGSGGGVRGRGRDGSAALGTVYVRSRSVLDEALPTTDQQQAALELSNDFDQHVDVLADGHPRRKGLVSRMRRTASNVIRHPFRSSSSNSGGVSRPGAADLTGSGGAHNAPFGSGDGGGRQGQRGGGARGGGGGSAGGMGVVPALSISSASPGSVSTAVPTPSAATPASDRDQEIGTGVGPVR